MEKGQFEKGKVECGEVVIRTCEGYKADGTPCNSPALRGRTHCYYHGPARRETRNSKRETVLPDFRNPQQMLAWAMTQLATGHISTKAAGQLIYAVQQLM